MNDDQAPTMVSPPRVDARVPLLSPDGQKLAFVGRRLDERGFREEPRLYVIDLERRETQVFSQTQDLQDFSLAPVAWDQAGRVLQVLTDHGETGGHSAVISIALN